MSETRQDWGVWPGSWPAEWAERVRALRAGTLTPVPPRRAATVVLLRAGAEQQAQPPAGPDVYLLRRHRGMAFAGGMCAFPGGGVDRGDAETPAAWSGPSPAAWARRLGGLDPAEAAAVVCAAIRETFEECGVLLAGPAGGGAPVADVSGDSWERDRADLAAHRIGLAQLLDRRRLAPRTDLLAAWSRWTTPEIEPRRYDAWFLLAVLPAGQRARDVSGEADAAGWLPLTAAVERQRRGELAMLPPTAVTLRQLAAATRADDGAAGDPAAVLRAAEARDLRPIQPEINVDEATGAPVMWVPGQEEGERP